MKIVISLGGSVFESSVEKIKRFAEVFDEISRFHQVFIVVGGGKLARELIAKAKELGANEAMCDYIGIAVTRLNAMLLAFSMKNSTKKIPESFIEAEELAKNHRAVIMGGTIPGHTTDATAALLAEFVNADLFLNATSVDGIYSDDPKRNPNAIKFEKMSPGELLEIVVKQKASAGVNVVMDVLAAKILERSRIKTVVFKGEPENILKVIKGERIGTLIA